MPNYQNGKIYKLVSNISNDIYIGSTVNKLSHRLNEHKHKANACVSKQLFTDDAVIQIILIESCPCNNKSELTAREHHYITTLVCINKRIPFVTDIFGDRKEWMKAWGKAYYESHADEILAQNKAYNESHAAEISAYQKAYYESHAAEKSSYQKAYNELHAAEISAYQKAYNELHAVELAAKRKAKYLKKKAQTTELTI